MIERPNRPPYEAVGNERDGKDIGSSEQDQNFVSENLMDQTASKGLPLTGLQRPISLLHYDYKSITFHLQRSLIVQTHPRIQGKSLYLFMPDNRLRKMLGRATESWIFEVVIILLIIASSVILAFEHPLDDPESKIIKQLK